MPFPKNVAIAAALVAGSVAVVLWGWRTDWGGDDRHPSAPTPLVDADAAAPEANAGPAQPAADAPRTEREIVEVRETSHADRDRHRQTAVIEVVLHFSTRRAGREVSVLALGEFSDRAAPASRFPGEGLEAVGILDVPPDRWIHVVATVDGVHVPGRRLRLGPGERHRIDLTPPPHATELRVLGPSSALAAHLVIEFVDRGAAPAEPFRLPLAADGTVRGAFAGPLSAAIVLAGLPGRARSVPLRTFDGALEFDPSIASVALEPTEPVLGIGATRRGRPVETVVRLDDEPLTTIPAPCSITTRRAAADTTEIRFATEPDGRQHRALRARVAHLSDLWTVELETLEPLGELAVTLDPAAPASSTGALEATPWGGGAAIEIGEGPVAGVRSAALPAGAYRLAWALAGSDPLIARDNVLVERGRRTEIELSPPDLQTWAVELADAPPGLSLALHVGEQFLAYRTSETMTVALPRAPEVGQPAWIVVPTQRARFEAVFAKVDTRARRATVTSTLSDAVATRIAPLPLRPAAPRRIWLLPSEQNTASVDGSWFFFGDEVHLLPGQTRCGYVTESIDGSDQLTCWFEAVGDTPEIAPSPAGRWATLSLPRAPSRVEVRCVGALGRSGPLRIRADQRVTPIYVAEGTTEIHVEFEGAVRTFDAQLAEFVVR